MHDVLARLQVGQRIHRRGRAGRPLAPPQGILAEQLVVADDDGVERLDDEALVDIAERQLEVVRQIAGDLLDDLGDPLDLGGALAIEKDLAALLRPLDQLFQGGLMSGPERSGLALELLDALDVELEKFFRLDPLAKRQMCNCVNRAARNRRSPATNRAGPAFSMRARKTLATSSTSAGSSKTTIVSSGRMFMNSSRCSMTASDAAATMLTLSISCVDRCVSRLISRMLSTVSPKNSMRRAWDCGLRGNPLGCPDSSGGPSRPTFSLASGA